MQCKIVWCTVSYAVQKVLSLWCLLHSVLYIYSTNCAERMVSSSQCPIYIVQIVLSAWCLLHSVLYIYSTNCAEHICLLHSVLYIYSTNCAERMVSSSQCPIYIYIYSTNCAERMVSSSQCPIYIVQIVLSAWCLLQFKIVYGLQCHVNKIIITDSTELTVSCFLHFKVQLPPSLFSSSSLEMKRRTK